MSSEDINRPFGEVLAERFADYMQFAAQGALQVGNDISITCLSPQPGKVDGPQLWGVAVVTKDALKANIFIHAVNLIVSIILFAVDVGRKAHHVQSFQQKGELDHGS